MMQWTLPLALVATLGPASCTTTTGSGGTDEAQRVACGVFQPIAWSRNDTDETIRAVKAHNAAGKSLCGWGS